MFTIKKNVNVNDVQYQRCQWHRSGVFIVNCKHVSNFVIIVNFEQANFCSFHIEKANIFEDKIENTMLHIILSANKIFYQIALTNTITILWVNQWEIFAKEFTSEVHSGYKDAAHIQNDLLYVHFLHILLARRLNRDLTLSCCKLSNYHS